MTSIGCPARRSWMPWRRRSGALFGPLPGRACPRRACTVYAAQVVREACPLGFVPVRCPCQGFPIKRLRRAWPTLVHPKAFRGSELTASSRTGHPATQASVACVVRVAVWCRKDTSGGERGNSRFTKNLTPGVIPDAMQTGIQRRYQYVTGDRGTQKNLEQIFFAKSPISACDITMSCLRRNGPHNPSSSGQARR